MSYFIILTIVLSIKALVERDRYSFIATSESKDIVKQYTTKELRSVLIDIVLRVLCSVYELIFYAALFIYTRSALVLAFAALHWGVFTQEVVNSKHRKHPFTGKEWKRRVALSRVWAGSEVAFLSYLLYSLRVLS